MFTLLGESSGTKLVNSYYFLKAQDKKMQREQKSNTFVWSAQHVDSLLSLPERKDDFGK